MRDNEALSETRTSDLVVLQAALGQEKDRPNKWLQSESPTLASYFGSGVCLAEPHVMLFATGVMKTKPLYCNGLVIFNIVESRQKEWKKQTD